MYQKALTAHLAIKQENERTEKHNSASIYHQLGRVAQEQRQWDQAEHYFQQALQIYVEFQDHYSQASTYHNLGIVAQAQRQWNQAYSYFLQALKIFVEHKDTYSSEIV